MDNEEAKKIKPPKNSPDFKKYWKILFIDIAERDNFKKSHLKQLSILCDTLVKYDDTEKFIDENGFTYESQGRNGIQIKTFPQVDLNYKYSKLIKDYCKQLDITIAKDNKLNEEDEDDDWE